MLYHSDEWADFDRAEITAQDRAWREEAEAELAEEARRDGFCAGCGGALSSGECPNGHGTPAGLELPGFPSAAIPPGAA